MIIELQRTYFLLHSGTLVYLHQTNYFAFYNSYHTENVQPPFCRKDDKLRHLMKFLLSYFTAERHQKYNTQACHFISIIILS